MNSARENKWNRKQSDTPGPVEINFFRLVAEDDGDQERADRMLGSQLDAELIALAEARFLAIWTIEHFTAQRAKWNAATGHFAEREKATGINFADLSAAKRLLKIA